MKPLRETERIKQTLCRGTCSLSRMEAPQALCSRLDPQPPRAPGPSQAWVCVCPEDDWKVTGEEAAVSCPD